MFTKGVSNLTTDLAKPKLFTKKRKIEREEAELSARIQEYIPSQCSSPLSKEGRELRKHAKVKPTSSAKSLFIDQREYGITLYDLSRIYNLNFVHPPVHSKIHEFFALGEILMQIEYHFKDRLFLYDLKPLRERLRTILFSNMSHEQMMSELGTFLYLLDRDGIPPSLEILSYTDFRAEEMRLEVERLLETHHRVVDSSHEGKVPSGKTHYILRTFSRMALTSNQKLNKGALYAILRILENATSPVPGYLKPEHQAHILCIVRQIIANPAFETLIEIPFLVHPDLETLIRIDLKLPKEAQVKPEFDT